MSSIATRNAAATVLAAAVMAGGLAALAQPASAAQRPANDLFNRAENLTSQGCDASTDGTNVGATGQANEPSFPGVGAAAPVQSVWFKWKSPVSDTVVIDTQGSDFDTLLGVYTGTTLPGLRLVTGNDDVDPANGDFTSEVSFEARRNVTYKIAIDGYHDQTCEDVLNITC
jgi:hypothetical protein